jgi:hypothetical protein
MNAKYDFIEPGEKCYSGTIAHGHIGGNDDRLPAMLAECTGCALPLMQVVTPNLSDRKCATIKHTARKIHNIRQVILASSPHTPMACWHT